MTARELLWNLQRQVLALKYKKKEFCENNIANIINNLEKQVSIDEEINGIEFEYEIDRDMYLESKDMLNGLGV